MHRITKAYEKGLLEIDIVLMDTTLCRNGIFYLTGAIYNFCFKLKNKQTLIYSEIMHL